MSDFLTDTILWTGGLIALVLVLRRPIVRWFGPAAGYSLWLLPMLRLLLPPLVLPAWLAPAEPTDAVAVADLAYMAEVPASPFDNPAPMPVAESGALFDWASFVFAVWLIGTAVFLARRYALYFKMRRTFLADARPVGEADGVRLVETPAADGPVAFGVIDKVVALPIGFMASRDIEARDLALAHELAHHRGRDLLANMLVQPLFAVHWFNPLCWLGWQALRRDQEAACDARVVGHAPRERRAAYAAVIARYATAQPPSANLALAAPMACPVLGGRSILHRLRTITMTDISTRRRWAGRALIGAAAMALPLTASISYAQDEVAPPAPPAAPAAPPAPDAPPAPVAPAAPAAAAAPDAPNAPVAPSATEGDRHVKVIRIERRYDKDGKPLPVGELKDGKGRVSHRVFVRSGDMEGMSAEDRAEFEKDMAELRREFGADGDFRKEMHRQFAKDGEVQKEIRIAMAEAHNAAPRVMVQCRQGQKDVTVSGKAPDGRETLFVCHSAATAQARAAIAKARADIAANRELSAAQRKEILESLDEADNGLRDED